MDSHRKKKAEWREYENTEESKNIMKLGVREIDDAWSFLARKTKEEVPAKHKVHEASWHRYVGKEEGFKNGSFNEGWCVCFDKKTVTTRLSNLEEHEQAGEEGPKGTGK